MISVIDNTNTDDLLNLGDISDSAQVFLDFLGRSDDEVTILFETNDGIQKINALYAKNDKSTDVLSFQNNEINPETGNLYLGDIVISLDKVISQSEEKAHPFRTELFILIAHGILHLLKYDHADPYESKIMFSKQEELVKKVLTVSK